MSFDHWSNLTYGIEQGECVLLLGPELPLLGPDGASQTPVERLRRRLLERLANGESLPPELGEGNISGVAQRFIDQESEFDLEVELREWHRGLEAETSAIHDTLAKVPFRLIVTGSYDPLMEHALRRAGKNPQVQRYHHRGSNTDLLPVPTVAEPVLFHLHGTAADPSSVVVTELQMLDFLAAVIGKDPPLPNDLNAALTSSRLFLFLGFGLEQWYLRILLHVLKVLRKGNRSFAIEISEMDPHSPVADAILFYRQNYKLDVHEEELLAFVTALQSRCTTPEPDAETAAGGPAQAESAADKAATRVFICHASEDAEHARSIYDVLLGAGFEPWLDRESLRGGDRWDSMIGKTIDSVDYFVVINSGNLGEKARGPSYVVKEIKTALKADEMRFEHFIIPVLVDDAPLLEQLSDFHAVDYRNEGPKSLVRAIKRQSRAA